MDTGIDISGNGQRESRMERRNRTYLMRQKTKKLFNVDVNDMPPTLGDNAKL
jgi:hypothetical protein